MRKIFPLALAVILGSVSLYDFESVPSQVKVRGRGSVSTDTDRFKDGAASLRFSWTGQAELLLQDPQAIQAFMGSRKGGVMFWLCNETPSREPVRVIFRDQDGRDICWFEFGMNFRGWRAAWVRYEDMLTDAGFVGDIPVRNRRHDGVLMAIRPSARVAAGSFCLDRLTFTADAIHHQNTPDAQIPGNNRFLSRRNMWHWARLQEWENYPQLGPAPSVDERSLALLQDRLDDFFRDDMPSGAAYDPIPYRKTLEKDYAALKLQRLPDGTPRGTPIVSNDESTSADIRMQQAFTVMYRLAIDYRISGDKEALERFFLVADHLVWQGVDKGSGMGTNHHYGYNIRGWADALWILRDEIRARGRMETYREALAYWSGEAECRLPFETDRDEVVDSWNTLLLPKMVVCMLQETPALQQSHWEALTRWMDGSMRFSHGTLGGIKADGTTFHHGGNYPAYATGAYSTLGTYFRLVEGSSFVPAEEARRCVKTGLLALLTWCNRYDWATGISGRHPFGGKIPAKVRNTYGYLALLGDLSGNGGEVDPELGGAYLYLKGNDKAVNAALKTAKITESTAPEGFFVYNYGAFGMHRRAGWAVTLKAYNSNVWGSEIYAKNNRYGRYQSYGSVQVINTGKPAGMGDSRYAEPGWDWNRLPGTTTIHLPWDKLDSPLPGTLMERNDSSFPGVSSLEGRNGVLAFTYTEKDRKNFCSGATATKSVFCFDNRLVFIGTGITNTSEYPTETTLFQQRLSLPSEAILVDGELINAFPVTLRKQGRVVVEDLKGNCYILYDARNLVIYRQHQQSPDNTGKKSGEGDFVSAVLDHGISPVQESYEYLLLVEPTSAQRKACSKIRPYQVLEASRRAHIVKDIATGITACVAYEEYSSETMTIPAQTIVMVRDSGAGRIMSVCTPDLGITEKTYTTSQESRPLARKLVLAGSWALGQPYVDAVFGTEVQVSPAGDRTILNVTCRHGQPVEFSLIKI